MAAAQVDSDPEKRRVEGERQTSPVKQTLLVGTGSGRTDGGAVSVEAEAPQKAGRMKPQPPGEQMEVYPGAETTTGSRLDDQNKCLTSVCLGNVTVMFTLRGISPTKHVFIASHGKQIHGLSFRETMSADFLAACQFLSDHMDNMENPNEEMVRTLPSLLSCFVVLCLCKSVSKRPLFQDVIHTVLVKSIWDLSKS